MLNEWENGELAPVAANLEANFKSQNFYLSDILDG